MTQFTVSRRQMLAGAAAFGALAPFGGVALAQEPGRWPAVSRLITRYVEQRKVANMVAALGTARDYDRFLRMLLGYGRYEGKRVLSEAAVRLGTSDLLPDTLTGKDEHGTIWGFGALGRVGRGDHTGIYGWAGAAGTLGFVDMKRQLRAGLFTQYMPQMEYPLIDEFPKAILADLAARERA